MSLPLIHNSIYRRLQLEFMREADTLIRLHVFIYSLSWMLRSLIDERYANPKSYLFSECEEKLAHVQFNNLLNSSISA